MRSTLCVWRVSNVLRVVHTATPTLVPAVYVARSFLEASCTVGPAAVELVFFDACLDAMHRWPGKDGDGPGG